MATLGNVGASALVKSAASLASQIADYNDKMQALQWNSSAQTEADYEAYSKYLGDRVTNLNDQGSLASASKALTLSTTLQSANRSYVSNSIQQQSINILEGTATPVDKQNAIVQFYQQAVANGDENLAQNLQQQYDSLNQQIQYDAVTGATAQTALDKANATAIKQGYTDAASALEDSLANVGADFAKGGQGIITKDLQGLAKSLGTEIPTGAAANNGSVIAGVLDTLAKYHSLAADAVKNTDSSAYNSESQKASDYINNITGINVGGAHFTMEDAQFYAAHPDAYYQTTTGVDIEGRPTYGLKQAAIEGYQYDQTGTAIPIFSTSDQTSIANDADAKKQAQTDLQNAGFTVKTNSDGSLTATATTDGKNAFFQNAVKGYGLATNTQYHVTKTAAGYQFAPLIDNGGASHLLTLSKDITGKFGIYQQDFNPATKTQTYNLIGQFDGYNALENDVTKTDPNATVNAALAKSFANYSTLPPGYTESTIIPQIAKQFFNGNTTAAETAVYNYRKPLELAQQTAANPLLTPKNNQLAQPGAISTAKTTGLIGVPTLKPTNAVTTPAPTQNSTAAKVVNSAPVAKNTPSLAIPTLGATKPSLQQAITSAFSNYKSQPSGYTENVVLKNIANTYFNGDIKAASTPVYQYRAATFGS